MREQRTINRAASVANRAPASGEVMREHVSSFAKSDDDASSPGAMHEQRTINRAASVANRARRAEK